LILSKYEGKWVSLHPKKLKRTIMATEPS